MEHLSPQVKTDEVRIAESLPAVSVGMGSPERP
jgi:hypothetical protein